MKPLLALSCLMLCAACVTNQEFDRERAYKKCESIAVESTRDRCIADVLQQAARERDRDAERARQLEEDAEKRELGREIAGADPD